jgi:hypothetical protein
MKKLDKSWDVLLSWEPTCKYNQYFISNIDYILVFIAKISFLFYLYIF